MCQILKSAYFNLWISLNLNWLVTEFLFSYHKGNRLTEVACHQLPFHNNPVIP